MKTRLFFFTFVLVTLQAFTQEIGDETDWDLITFEEAVPEYLEIGESSENIWQIGEPDKLFFDSAYSPENAIVTDTLNTYPVNNHSYFDMAIGYFNAPGYDMEFFIEMKHKFDTDFHKDGGYITISYDNKQTWVNIIEDISPVYEFSPADYPEDGWMHELYTTSDTLYNGEYGFSGHSDDWVTTKFGWYFEPCRSQMDFDTLYVRFNFVSDGVETGHEGWMIDDIRLFWIYMGTGVNDKNTLDFTIFPNPFTKTAAVRLDNYSGIEMDIYDIQGRLVKREKYLDNVPVIIDRDKLTSGVYFVRIRTEDNMAGVSRLVVE